MSTKPTVLALAGLSCAATLIAGPQIAQAHPRAQAGKLRVKPGDVMVNTTVTVTGKGFARNSSVVLRECGRTSWLVPEEVCNTENAITVQTGRHGHFVTPFKAQVCPEGVWEKVPTERTCYIGVPQVSMDSVALVPWVKLIVTYP